MAFSVTIRPLVLVIALVFISTFCCNLGKAYDEDVPETSTTGVVGYDSYTGSGMLGNVPQTGAGVGGISAEGVEGDNDPAQIVAEALLCFNEKHIYRSCEESFRLSMSGDLHVPSDSVDAYCGGPCLAETHLVLNCLENIMEHFEFYNKATINDIRDTVNAGCGHGPERGNFNVAERLQAKENSAYKKEIQISVGVGLTMAIIGHVLLV